MSFIKFALIELAVIFCYTRFCQLLCRFLVLNFGICQSKMIIAVSGASEIVVGLFRLRHIRKESDARGAFLLRHKFYPFSVNTDTEILKNIPLCFGSLFYDGSIWVNAYCSLQTGQSEFRSR